MSKIDELAKKITDMAASKKTSAYDTQAEVLRIEDGTAWVHIPGGVDETPVQLTVSAGVGDYVQVRVANGNAWIVGNASNPPTDDREALEAKDKAISAQEKAEDAMIASERAEEAAVVAETAAVRATEAAEEAEGEAGKATKAANSALRGLAQVEDVVGVLNWLAEHSKPTEDEIPYPGKTYYIKTESGSLVVVENVEGKNPAVENWFELSEAVQNYIMQHLVLTDAGLKVFGRSDESEVILSKNGFQIYDPIKGLISSFGDTIKLGDNLSYLEILSTSLSFYLNNMRMSRFGYSDIFESYGVESENVFIKGSGNALRLDNNVNGSYQGQYILETRSNGHLSLKPGLRRTEDINNG